MSKTRLPDRTSASSTSRSLMCRSALSLKALQSIHPTAAESQCLCCDSRNSTELIALESILPPPRHPLQSTATLTDRAHRRPCSDDSQQPIVRSAPFRYPALRRKCGPEHRGTRLTGFESL